MDCVQWTRHTRIMFDGPDFKRLSSKFRFKRSLDCFLVFPVGDCLLLGCIQWVRHIKIMYSGPDSMGLFPKVHFKHFWLRPIGSFWEDHASGRHVWRRWCHGAFCGGFLYGCAWWVLRACGVSGAAGFVWLLSEVRLFGSLAAVSGGGFYGLFPRSMFIMLASNYYYYHYYYYCCYFISS